MNPPRVPASRYVCFLLIATAGVAWDLISKDIVFADLGYPGGQQRALQNGRHDLFAPQPAREGESRFYIDGWVTFRLFTSFNPGALWGIGQRHTWLFASLSVLAVVGVVYWLFGHRAAVSWWLTVSLSLILAGTLGNLHDRIGLHGCTDAHGESIRAVRDFLLFTFGGYHWPIFNFADTFLVTGAIMLVLHSLAVSSKDSEPAAQTVAEPSETAQTAAR
jgi:signal peptidase II